MTRREKYNSKSISIISEYTNKVFQQLSYVDPKFWARRVAWHPCTLGWYRLEFKSQRAHVIF